MKARRTIHVFIGIVTNKNGEILMAKRSEPELPEADSLWELPGGKADFGETAEESIIREILEETGYQVQTHGLFPTTVMHMWDYQDFDQHTIILCFRCSLINTERLKSADHHVSEVRWVKPDQIRNLLLLPGTDTFINAYLNDIKC